MRAGAGDPVDLQAVFDEAIAEALQGIFTTDLGLPPVVSGALEALAEQYPLATTAEVQGVRVLFEATQRLT